MIRGTSRVKKKDKIKARFNRLYPKDQESYTIMIVLQRKISLLKSVSKPFIPISACEVMHFKNSAVLPSKVSLMSIKNTFHLIGIINFLF